jgi:hypothetical protein
MMIYKFPSLPACFQARGFRRTSWRGPRTWHKKQDLFPARQKLVGISVWCASATAVPASDRHAETDAFNSGQPFGASCSLAEKPSDACLELAVTNLTPNPHPFLPHPPTHGAPPMGIRSPRTVFAGGSRAVVRQRCCRQRVRQGTVAALVLRFVFLVAIQAFLSLRAQSLYPLSICRYISCAYRLGRDEITTEVG